ncbi:hypothetical protein SNEBB_004223 [Seison nebaliae]|nr:hypothetical protein SNEBB_004223 [Seison nebaliae]
MRESCKIDKETGDCICPEGCFSGKNCLDQYVCYGNKKIKCVNGHCLNRSYKDRVSIRVKYEEVGRKPPRDIMCMKCVCDECYTGIDCSKPINTNCDHKFCIGGYCELKSNGMECVPVCLNSNIALSLLNCNTLRCHNGGTCSKDDNTLLYSCSCADGFTGKNCQHSSETITGVKCEGGGYAVGDKCICPNHLFGDTCSENVCAKVPELCMNEGNCISLENGVDYKCECAGEFFGQNCEFKGDNSTEVKCQEQSFVCYNGGKCIETGINLSCECPEHTSGNQCEVNSLCDDSSCNQGECVTITEGTVESLTYRTTCLCFSGFTGDKCTSKDLYEEMMKEFGFQLSQPDISSLLEVVEKPSKDCGGKKFDPGTGDCICQEHQQDDGSGYCQNINEMCVDELTLFKLQLFESPYSECKCHLGVTGKLCDTLANGKPYNDIKHHYIPYEPYYTDKTDLFYVARSCLLGKKDPFTDDILQTAIFIKTGINFQMGPKKTTPITYEENILGYYVDEADYFMGLKFLYLLCSKYPCTIYKDETMLLSKIEDFRFADDFSLLSKSYLLISETTDLSDHLCY